MLILSTEQLGLLRKNDKDDTIMNSHIFPSTPQPWINLIDFLTYNQNILIAVIYILIQQGNSALNLAVSNFQNSRSKLSYFKVACK